MNEELAIYLAHQLGYPKDEIQMLINEFYFNKENENDK